jgi:hypothetical protein
MPLSIVIFVLDDINRRIYNPLSCIITYRGGVGRHTYVVCFFLTLPAAGNLRKIS